jgi:hypothetical protein
VKGIKKPSTSVSENAREVKEEGTWGFWNHLQNKREKNSKIGQTKIARSLHKNNKVDLQNVY